MVWSTHRNFQKDIPIVDCEHCFYQSWYPICLQYWQQPLDIRVPIVVISCLSVPLVAMMFLLQRRISSDFNEEVFALGLTEEKQLEQNPRDQVHVQCTFFQCEHKHRKTDLWLGMPAVCDLLADWLRNLSSGPDPDYKSRALLHPTA